MMINRSNYLAHYGVKGMKWGVRKQRETKGISKRQRRQMAKKEKRDRAMLEANRKTMESVGASGKNANRHMVLIGEQNLLLLQPGTVEKGKTEVAKYMKEKNLDMSKYTVEIENGSVYVKSLVYNKQEVKNKQYVFRDTEGVIKRGS